MLQMAWDVSDAYEISMLEQGYAKAYTRFSDNGYVIEEGEYFTILYDNDDNLLYFLKYGDEEGSWMNIEDKWMSEVNPYFFFLAG